MKKEDYRKIHIECSKCKTQFEVWISEFNFSPGLEERIRKNFYAYCPVCKELEEMTKKKR